MLKCKPLILLGMENPPSDSEDLHLMGVRVDNPLSPGELALSLERIPEKALAIMARDRLRPILRIKEVREMGREFTVVDRFATRFDFAGS